MPMPIKAQLKIASCTIFLIRNTILEFCQGDISQKKFIKVHLTSKSNNENTSERALFSNSG